jgi:hypothetical protein
VTGFHWKVLCQLWDWDQRINKILTLQGYVVWERKLLVWHQLCSIAESFGLVLVWQHTTWGSARCAERRVPYTERVCWGYNLGKLEDEKHLLLVCPNIKKVKEHFCSTLPYPHEHSCWAHVDYKHGRLGQVFGMLPVPEDNLSSMIYLSFNGLSGPKRT